MTEEKSKLRSNKYGNVYSDVMLSFPVGRAFFANLSRPSAQYNKYQLTILYSKEDKTVQPALKKLKEDFLRLVTFKYGSKAALEKTKAADGTIVPPKFTVTHPPIFDGDTVTVSADSPDLLCKKYKEFKGCYFIRISNSEPITCVDRDKKRIDAKRISPGMKVDGMVQGMLFDKGISWKGLVVRLVEDDGTRLYTGPDPVSLLSSLGEDEVSAEEAADDALGSEEKSGKNAAVDIL